MIEFIKNFCKDKELVFNPLPLQHQIELSILISIFVFALIWDNHPTFRYLTRLFFGTILGFLSVFFSEIWDSIQKFFGIKH